ncbi:unnamed protein product [Rotaria socialis]
MGILSNGRPLNWSEIQSVKTILKNHALNDLILILNKHKKRHNDEFLWGDEIEYSLIRFNHENKRVQLCLKADEILKRFQQLNNDKTISELSQIIFHAEDCNFVIEGIPSKPYHSHPNNYYYVQSNMILRREQIQKILDKNEFLMTISAFPRLGCAACTHPEYKSDPLNSFESSICCSDHFKTPNHSRTMFLNKNVIERRQSKVSVNVPIMKDVNTKDPFKDDFSSYGIENWQNYLLNLRDNYIHLDSSSIGWGCCCLQVTFQAACFSECLHLYDQLIPLTSIFLSLTTACPIWRGYLSNVDSRWNILSQTTDDRTKEEIDNNILHSSRYSSVSCYLSQTSQIYNDIKINIDHEVYQTLINNDCPEGVARHFAHLFLRDPLYVTDEQVYPADGNPSTTYAFELQITDFENAAFTVFLSLLTRAILSYKIDLRMSISLVNQNMERAQIRNTIQQSKFHFPTTIFHGLNSNRNQSSSVSKTREMTIDEIINGSNNFIGLKSLILNYLNSFEDIDRLTRVTIENYLQFISERAKGTILTNAMWIRQFVLNHQLYKHDSVVSDEIQYDLMLAIKKLVNINE